MKKALIYVSLAILVFVTPSYSQEKKENPFSAKWDNGFKIERADQQIKMKFGGRIMYDMGFFGLNTEAEENGYALFSENGNEFRRARLFTSGTIYNNVDFKLQLDFAGGKTILKDAYITLKKLPVIGNFRVGHFVEPIVLESFTSSKYITFMERSLATGIVSGRNSGVMIFDENSSKRTAWQLGMYSGVNSLTSDSPRANGNYSVTGRIATTAVKTEESSVHLGFSYSFRKPQNEKTFGYSLRPEVHMANKYIKTNVENVNHINAFNVETSLVLGSFSLQSEYLSTKVDARNNSLNFNAFYALASYFLTGERRNYMSALYGYGRVKPKNNFGDGHYGALELALRYSIADGMENDQMRNITAGLNWHLNPATRVMVNYVFSSIENDTQYLGEGNFNAFQMRFQIDF